MRIAANVGVRDEIELIIKNIEHLRSIGVDDIVVGDLFSSDGTWDALQVYRDDPQVHLIQFKLGDPNLFRFTYKMLDYTRQHIKPDWVIFTDADEFWIPATGNIKDTRGLQTADVVRTWRFNIALSDTGLLWPESITPATYQDLMLITAPITDFNRYVKEHPDTPFILGQVDPKLIARPDRLGLLPMGGHEAQSIDGSPLNTLFADDLLVAHAAHSSRERFFLKVDNIRGTFKLFGDLFAGEQAWHWRRWLRIADEGGLDEEHERQIFSVDEMARLRAEGKINPASAWFRAQARRRTIGAPTN
jgi:hypothetical protein